MDKILEASDNQKSVLDVGSGSGAWCIDMAERYPHVHVLGIDIKPQHRSNVPSNYLSEICDVNDGLEKFYGQFDLVHTRFTAGVFSDPQAALIEMERCLKPGGLLIIISASFLISEDRKTMYPLYTQANPQGSWFQRSAIGGFPGVKKLGVDPRLLEREIDKGLWNHELLDPSSCTAALITPPIGPWATSLNPAEAARLKKVGEYWRNNILIVHHHWERVYEASGRSRAEWELTVKNVDEELRESRHHGAMRIRALWGRAKGFHGSFSKTLTPEKPDGSFQVLSIYDFEHEWVRLSEECQATITPEMHSFLDVPNFDAIL